MVPSLPLDAPVYRTASAVAPPPRSATSLVEVRVVWGHDAVLSVGHLRPGERFVLAPDGASTDLRFVHPAVIAAHAFVTFERGVAVLRPLPDARARVLRDGAWEDADGAVTLDVGTVAAQRLDDVTLVARCVPSTEPLPPPRRDRRFSVAVAAAFTGAMALTVVAQRHHDRDDDLLTRDTSRAWLDTHIAIITSRAHPPTHPIPDDAPEGGTGERALGEEGSTGRRSAADRYLRWRTPPTRGVVQQVTLPRRATGRLDGVELRGRGIFAALGDVGSRAAFALPALHEVTQQSGAMYGSAAGESFGYEGLGLLGRGWGGGGTSDQLVGLGRIRTRGHGMDDGGLQGGGSGSGSACGCGDAGTLGRGRGTGLGISVGVSRAPVVCGMAPERWARGERCVAEDGGGMLDPALIRRVVHANIGQVRRCYERALEEVPSAEGRLMVRWVIGGDGSVLAATVVDDTVGAGGVGDCVTLAVRRWQFPRPTGEGVVTVNYPFSLSRDGG